MNTLEQKMVDGSTTLVLLVEPKEGRIIRANKAASKLLGYPQENLLKLRILDIESSLQDVFYWEEVLSGCLTEITWQEGLYRTADDELVEVSKSVSLLEHDGAAYLMVQARDIRASRQVEERLEQTLSRLRATLEATGNGLLTIDWQGHVVSMNHMFSSMWGIPDHLLEPGQSALILAHLSAQISDPASLCRRLAVIVDAGETEEVFNLLDGRVFECKSRPQYLKEHIVGRVFSFADITRSVKAEEGLRQSRDELEQRVELRTAELRRANDKLQAERERQAALIVKLEAAQNQLLQSEKMASIGQLAAGVAHEINNPVGFIKSNLGTLQRYMVDLVRMIQAYAASEGELAPATRETVESLRQALDLDFLLEDLQSLLVETTDGVQRVQDIVRDLKSFSHVNSAEQSWSNLESGLDSTLNIVWNELKYKAQVVKEYAGLPDILCAPAQLNQVFMNFLVNAAQAIETQGEIRIRTGYSEREVWVEIEDNGVGIAPEHMNRLFEPFFTTKAVGKGTGLGLSLSYGIVKKHEGRIEVDSQLGRGTRFRVTLPRGKAADTQN
jgi:PAS domain S-box-containing protein